MDKARSLENKTSIDQYVKRDESVNTTLDIYTKLKNIKHIDLLKIDTECHEDKVLIGGKNLLENEELKQYKLRLDLMMFYQKYFNFSDIEKYLVPNNFRMVGIDLVNNNLFSGLTFAAVFCILTEIILNLNCKLQIFINYKIFFITNSNQSNFLQTTFISIFASINFINKPVKSIFL